MDKKALEKRRKRWATQRVSERLYASSLLDVARGVAALLKAAFQKGVAGDAPVVADALHAYATALTPWANAAARLMLADVASRDLARWKRNAADISVRLRQEAASTPVGPILQALQDEQVKLIKSLPLEAAERVHELARGAMLSGTRAAELVPKVLALGDVTLNRARTIARTEVGRVTSNLLQARSQSAGSLGYTWHTSLDADVRPSHAEMEGRYVRWSEPPMLDGMRGHAGCLPNCRCWAEPLFPDD